MRPLMNPIAAHEAGYQLGSRLTGIDLVLVKYRQDHLRCHFADVVVLNWEADADWFEKAALLMLIGSAAVAHFCPKASTDDELQARELLFKWMKERQPAPFPPSLWNEFNNLLAKLKTQARTLVAANAAEVAQTAARLV
jgi:hypothetical protein